MNCKKCNLPKTVTLRKRDFYCDDCFTNNITHKFRACLGKNKVLSPNENVLICLSGGVGSTVLVDLLHYGISLDNTKKLRVVPFFLHIINDNRTDIAESVVEQCRKYNFDVYVVHLSDYIKFKNQLPDVNCVQPANIKLQREFQNMVKCMPTTAANDFLLKVKRNLYTKYAKLMQCKSIFTAETTSTLAINLLCNIATGRGSQVQNDIICPQIFSLFDYKIEEISILVTESYGSSISVHPDVMTYAKLNTSKKHTINSGFCDTRDENVKILRPMKDISQEELDYYVKLKQLQPIDDSHINDTSLQSVISSFVNDLQENFQSTISTVCKTADKIGHHDEVIKQERCSLCESDLNANNHQGSVSALEATIISRIVSSRSGEFDRNESSILDDDIQASLPLAHKFLCYGCSRIHLETSSPSLTQYLQKNIQ